MLRKQKENLRSVFVYSIVKRSGRQVHRRHLLRMASLLVLKKKHISEKKIPEKIISVVTYVFW